jgi:hypothetical protein
VKGQNKKKLFELWRMREGEKRCVPESFHGFFEKFIHTIYFG